MEIAVIGGGNGSYATAADLAEQGHQVRMWRRNTKDFASLLETRKLILKDFRGTREVELSIVSTNLGQVVKGAELLIIPLPATTQTSVALTLAPYLEDGQIIYFTPGTFGSYLMAKKLKEVGCKAEIIFAESGTLPYLARKHGPGMVVVSGRTTRLPTGVYPSNKSELAFSVLKQVFPAIVPLQNALDGALMNAGPIIHPPLILMNAGPIEHFEKWDIHNEGTQPAIRRVHDALDAERIAVRERLGYGAPHFPLSDHYNPEGDEWMYGRAAHEKLVDSADWFEHLDLRTHRYMLEDVACGLALLVSIAEWADVPVPVARGLLAVASAVVGEDLRLTGRTLENLGLAKLTEYQMKSFLEQGLEKVL